MEKVIQGKSLCLTMKYSTASF